MMFVLLVFFLKPDLPRLREAGAGDVSLEQAKQRRLRQFP